MPNYYTHEIFGADVVRRLPPALRQTVEQDADAFRVGLYGPDPLIFTPGCLNTSRKLHRGWREEMDCIQELLNHPRPGEVGFAMGWLCHMTLDEACHQYIYQVAEEQGLSHMIMEMSLDFCVQQERAELPDPFRVYQKPRISKLATSLITPARTWQYWEGLWSMGMSCHLMVATRRHWKRQVNPDYAAPTARLRRIMVDTVDSAVALAEDLYEAPQHAPLTRPSLSKQAVRLPFAATLPI